jgi:hypothetical protein
MYLGLLRKEDDHVHNKHNLGASPPLVSRVFFRVSAMLPRSHLAIWAVSVYSLSCVARTEALLMASDTVIIDMLGLTSILFRYLLSYVIPTYLAAFTSILRCKGSNLLDLYSVDLTCYSCPCSSRNWFDIRMIRPCKRIE